MYEEDRRIKRRVKEAHAGAGEPSYTEVAARINASHPQVEATKAQVDHWLAQGSGSIVIPARAIPALAEAFGVSIAKLLGAEERVEREIEERVRKLEEKHEAVTQSIGAVTEILKAQTTGEGEPVGEALDLLPGQGAIVVASGGAIREVHGGLDPVSRELLIRTAQGDPLDAVDEAALRGVARQLLDGPRISASDAQSG